MIRIGTSNEDLKAASSVARNVELLSVILVKSRFSNSINEDEPTQSSLYMELGKPSGRYVISAKNNLIVFCNLKVRGLAKERNKEDKKKLPAILQAEVEFAMEFRLPEGDIPIEIKDKGLPAFSRLNGPYICWPYFRQFIYSICSQANITNVTLPILTVGAKQKKVTKRIGAETSLKKGESASLKK